MRFDPVASGSRWRAGLLLAVVASLAAGAAGADAPDLLANERAFAFSVRAVDAQTLEARFVVAPGYYLYRDKLRFELAPASLAAPPALPAGESKHDEFFGASETYRGGVVVRLRLAEPLPGRTVTVLADSQGCADVGVCYPPQRQKVAVALPRAGGKAGEFVEAAPAPRRWFQ
ncbi:MAG: protein-disulfide reductase DsbD N-terminal domain-containing protein [Casimicrobiaceae bacterium]